MTKMKELERQLQEACDKIEAQTSYIQTLESKIGVNTYTEKELLLAIEYACGYQKAEDYQQAGHIAMQDFLTVDEADTAIGKTLDYLCSTENTSKEITIQEINEYIQTNLTNSNIIDLDTAFEKIKSALKRKAIEPYFKKNKEKLKVEEIEVSGVDFEMIRKVLKPYGEDVYYAEKSGYKEIGLTYFITIKSKI